MYRVMIVDDEIMIKKSLTQLINQSPYGFEVSGQAEDGGEALDLWDAEPVDLIISDISMPVMDGLEFIRELRGRNADVDIVILSGYGEFAYAQQGLRLGVADYLLKPVREEQLDGILGKVWNKLEQEGRYKQERGLWLQHCDKAAKLLAEQIWLLNEAEALRLWEEFVARLNRADLETRLSQSMLEDIAALIEGELRARGAEGIESPKPLSFSRAINVGREQKAEVSYVSELINRMRITRNWGQRHHIQRALAYINSRLHDSELTMHQAAEISGMSMSYFSRSFKEEMGDSFTEYIINKRMEQAKLLLRNPDSKNYEIALSVGYTDYPHFAKSFKKYCGLSPKEYRNRMYGK